MKTINLNVPKNLYSALESNAIRNKTTIPVVLSEFIEYIFKLETAITIQDKFCLLVVKHFKSNFQSKIDIRKIAAEKASISYMSERELAAITNGWELEEIGQVGITPCFYAVGLGYYYIYVDRIGLMIEVDLNT